MSMNKKLLRLFSTCFPLCLSLSSLSANARTWIVNNRHVGAADRNSGTANQPLLTIDAAAQKAQPGDIVLVHEGIYRERVSPLHSGQPDKNIIYEAAPGESVFVKGSDIWTHWQPVAEKPGVFTAEIAGHVPVDVPNPFLIGISVAPDDQNIVARPSSERDHLPKTLGQIFFNGRPMVEADSEPTVYVQENSWIVTADGRQLLAHFSENPTNLSNFLIEVSIRNRIFAPHIRGLNYIQVKGFTFEHCANQGPFPQGGEVSTRSGAYWIIEGNTIRFAKMVGLDIGSETFNPKNLKDTDDDQKVRMEGGHNLIEGNTVTDNGLLGIEGWHHNSVIIRNNIVERNNALGFSSEDAKWEEWGGIKLHGTNALIEGNLVRDNDGYGIWIDNDYTDSHITRNVVVNNRMAGIFLELGDGRCLIDNNIVALTQPRGETYGGIGIYAHDSSGLIICHNLIMENADCGVLLRTVSNRVFPPPWEPNSRPVRTSNSRVLNNIIWNNSGPAISLPYPNDRASNNVSDYNLVGGSHFQSTDPEHYTRMFAINLYKSSVDRKQLTAKFLQALTDAHVPDRGWPNLEVWGAESTLPLSLWNMFMGQDKHSRVLSNGTILLLAPEVPKLIYQLGPSASQCKCPPVGGVDHDFFDRPLSPSDIHPGPFQNSSELKQEEILFPVRF